MIFDAFPFDGELDMLSVRMVEWSQVPDVVHIAVEGNTTFRGQPKPYRLTDYCEQHGTPERLAAFTCDLDPDPNPWVVERQQRDALLSVLAAFDPDPDDVVLSCDADEIPRATVLAGYRPPTPTALEMRHHVWSTAWLDPTPWTKASAFRWADRPESLHDMRLSARAATFRNAGWHLSWFGTPAIRVAKLGAFSHAEYDTAEARAFLGADLAGMHLDGRQLVAYQDDDDWPGGFTRTTLDLFAEQTRMT